MLLMYEELKYENPCRSHYLASSIKISACADELRGEKYSHLLWSKENKNKGDHN